jgi:hypothetical protein
MITQLFDLTVYLNNKQYSIINTELKLQLEWNVELQKTEDAAKLKFLFKRLFGNFSIHEHKELYKRASTYTFSTDEKWSYTQLIFESDNISPTSAIINFDDKSVKIKF